MVPDMALPLAMAQAMVPPLVMEPVTVTPTEQELVMVQVPDTVPPLAMAQAMAPPPLTEAMQHRNETLAMLPSPKQQRPKVAATKHKFLFYSLRYRAGKFPAFFFFWARQEAKQAIHCHFA